MISRRILLIPVLLSLLAGGCARSPSGVNAGVGPLAVFPEPIYNGPEVAGKLKNRFVVRNEGDAPLRITKLTASCGCTTTSLAKDTLAPGESSAVEAVMSVLPNRRQSSVMVETNDPRNPSVTLVLASSGLPPNQVEFLPDTLRLRRSGGEGARARGVIRVTVWRANAAQVGLDDLKFTTSDPSLSLRLLEEHDGPGTIPGWGPSQPTRLANAWYRSDAVPDRTIYLRPVEAEIRAAPANPSGLAQFAAEAQLPEGSKALPGILLISVADGPSGG